MKYSEPNTLARCPKKTQGRKCGKPAVEYMFLGEDHIQYKDALGHTWEQIFL